MFHKTLKRDANKPAVIEHSESRNISNGENRIRGQANLMGLYSTFGKARGKLAAYEAKQRKRCGLDRVKGKMKVKGKSKQPMGWPKQNSQASTGNDYKGENTGKEMTVNLMGEKFIINTVGMPK